MHLTTEKCSLNLETQNCCLLIHSIRGGTEVSFFFCICLKALQCYFKGQACATSVVSTVEERVYLHCFIAHDDEEEEEEGKKSVNKTDLRVESELVKQNIQY